MWIEQIWQDQLGIDSSYDCLAATQWCDESFLTTSRCYTSKQWVACVEMAWRENGGSQKAWWPALKLPKKTAGRPLESRWHFGGHSTLPSWLPGGELQRAVLNLESSFSDLCSGHESRQGFETRTSLMGFCRSMQLRSSLG